MVALFLLCGSLLPACSDDEGHPSDSDSVGVELESAERYSRPEPVPSHQPSIYDGLTLEEWKKRLKTLGPGVPGAAAAIPGLRAIAEDRAVDPELRSQVTVMLGRLGKPGLAALPTLEKLLKEPPNEKGIPAVWSAKAIALLGPAARETVPHLIEVLENRTTPREAQWACLEALARIGGHHSQAIPAIVRTLKRAVEDQVEAGDRGLLMASIDAFFLIGPGASVAVPELMGLLDNPHELVRLKVVQALGAIGEPSSPAANTLAEMLVFDESDAIRSAAAFALASIGPEAHGLLFHLAGDEEIRVRTYCIEALGAIQPRKGKLDDLLAQALRDESAEVRLAAAITFKADASHRAEVLIVLTRLVADRRRSIKLSAANHLASMRPDDQEWERLRSERENRLDTESLRLWERVERMRKDRGRGDTKKAPPDD